jgi:hypothetical protein
MRPHGRHAFCMPDSHARQGVSRIHPRPSRRTTMPWRHLVAVAPGGDDLAATTWGSSHSGWACAWARAPACEFGCGCACGCIRPNGGGDACAIDPGTVGRCGGPHSGFGHALKKTFNSLGLEPCPSFVIRNKAWPNQTLPPAPSRDQVCRWPLGRPQSARWRCRPARAPARPFRVTASPGCSTLPISKAWVATPSRRN